MVSCGSVTNCGKRRFAPAPLPQFFVTIVFIRLWFVAVATICGQMQRLLSQRLNI